MRNLAVRLGAIATATMVTSAWSRELPQYCEMEATRNNSFNAAEKTAFAAVCQESVEPRFAEVIKYKWGYIPDRIQDDCIRSAHGGYEKLNRCLDNALDVYSSSSLPQIWTLEWVGQPLGRYWTLDECSSQRQQRGGICRLGFK